MVGDARDVVACLRLHFGADRLLLRVGGAREQEVLPGEQAQLVGEVVEVVVFVDAAAPHAHEVDPRGCGLPQSTLVPRAVDAWEERVVGDPVDALHPHRLLVDDQFERTPVVVGIGVPSQGAEAHPAGRLVEQSAAARGAARA